MLSKAFRSMTIRLKTQAQGFKALIICGAFSLLIIAIFGSMAALASQKKLVHLVLLKETIGSGMAAYIEDSLRKAEEAGADAVILEINTFC